MTAKALGNKIKKLSRWQKILALVITFFLVILIIRGITLGINHQRERARIAEMNERISQGDIPSWIDIQLIDIDGAARRGVKVEKIKNIVIHYVGNPGSSAQANRNYFNNDGVAVSSHFVVGLQGEVIQCVPLDEKSSASNERNIDTISIEVCHPDEGGKFNDSTYRSVVKLSAWLCKMYGLTGDDLIRHYDVIGKNCPKYYVEHEDAWKQLKTDVNRYLSEDHDFYAEEQSNTK